MILALWLAHDQGMRIDAFAMICQCSTAIFSDAREVQVKNHLHLRRTKQALRLLEKVHCFFLGCPVVLPIVWLHAGSLSFFTSWYWALVFYFYYYLFWVVYTQLSSIFSDCASEKEADPWSFMLLLKMLSTSFHVELLDISFPCAVNFDLLYLWVYRLPLRVPWV